MWIRWERFCQEIGAIPLPADPAVFEHFLARTAYDGTKTNYATAAAAIAWRHCVAGYCAPNKSPRVGAIIAGAKRMLAAPAVRKAPLTISMLRELVKVPVSNLCSSPDAPYSASRFRFYSLVAFYALLRYSDFAVLRVRHFSFVCEHMVITIPQSKCDQYRQGDTVTVAVNSGSPSLCPVNAARSYVALLHSASATEETYVLQSVIQGRDGQRALGRVASRAVLSGQLRRALHGLVGDPARYSLHSFRAGGATTAAATAEVSRDELKRHGRWASAAVDSYIEPTLTARLNITRKMSGDTRTVFVT